MPDARYGLPSSFPQKNPQEEAVSRHTDAEDDDQAHRLEEMTGRFHRSEFIVKVEVIVIVESVIVLSVKLFHC